MDHPTFASSSFASSSRTPLRHRPNPHQTADAIANGAYLAHAPTTSARRDKGKGRARDTPRKTLIPGHPIGSKGWVREAFRLFGEHCARNQIRTLLIDCLVMTNLFYPALSIYIQKRAHTQDDVTSRSLYNRHRTKEYTRYRSHTTGRRKEHPMSLLRKPFLDTFFPYPPSLLPPVGWTNWWEDPDTEDEWAATFGEGLFGDQDVRLLRIAWTDADSVLARDGGSSGQGWTERDLAVLDMARSTAEGWENSYMGLGEDCVRHLEERDGVMLPTGSCFEVDARQSSSLASIESVGGANISTKVGYHSPYRSVGFLMRVGHPVDGSFDARWASAMESGARMLGAELFAEPSFHGAKGSEPEVWNLSFDSTPNHEPTQIEEQDTAPIPKFVLFLYIVLFSVLGSQLTSATKVHSRFGLAFTGITQTCCSAVMSFSVLALLGWNGWGWGSARGPSLPMYILPFVIVVVGAENMSTLTKAVFSVPFTYSVPARIGLGLSKVGSTIASTSLTRLAVLLLIWLCVNLRPVQEFCLFAAVVIITDWFMLHTFFLTVLSIDAQRLELADVLASGGGVTPAPDSREDQPDDDVSTNKGWKRAIRVTINGLGSLIIILVLIGFIYYYTERNRSLFRESNDMYDPTATRVSVESAFSTSPTAYLGLSRAAKLWRALNPLGLSSIRIVVPPASILVFPRAGHHSLPIDLRKLFVPNKRVALPRLEPIFYLLKVVVLPQAATAGALYSLLLYLLKDSDLLDAQRNRLGRNETHRVDEGSDEGDASTALQGVQVHMLPCSHEVDIDLVASSLDGSAMVSVGIDNSICLWRFAGACDTGTREILRHDGLDSEASVTDVTVSDDGSLIAVITDKGTICQWDIVEDEKPIAGSIIHQENVAPAQLHIVASRNEMEDPFIARPPTDMKSRWEFLVVGVDASVTSISVDGAQVVILPAASENARVHILDDTRLTSTGSALLVASPTRLVLHQRSDAGWHGVEIPATTGARLDCASIMNDNLVLGYHSGLVEVFDRNGTPVAAIGAGQAAASNGIKRVALAEPASTQCTTCRLVTSDSLFIVSSTENKVHIDRFVSRGTVTCRCPRRLSTVEDLRSANTGNTPARLVIPPTASRTGMTPGASPQKSPSLLPPVSNGDFPLSSHGTRRLSALHRDEASSSPGMYAAAGVSGPGGLSMTPSSPESDTEILPLGAVLVPAGSTAWSVIRDKVVGVRRVYGGIDDAQWEVWSVDLSRPWNGTQLVVDAVPLTDLLAPARVIPHSGVRAQRQERLLSMSGRAPFPSLGTSFSVATYAPLAYTEIRPFTWVHGTPEASEGKVVIGMGNRLGVISVVGERTARQKSSSGHLSARASLSGLGITPPPPASAKRELGEAKKIL